MQCTIIHVAKLAGVSPATVSRVVNRTAPVSPAVERKVRAAAAKLNFDLSRRGARLVAFLLGNRRLLHPFHSQVLESAEAFCSAEDYHMLFLTLHYNLAASARLIHLPDILQRRDSVDGFILAGVNSQGLLDLLASKRLPFAVFGDTMQGEWDEAGCDVVGIDDVNGAAELTRHLLGLGHKRVWYVANLRQGWFARRHRGYLSAMEQAGRPPLVCDIDSENEYETGFLAARRILSRDEPPEAIFAGSDAICHGVYAAIREAGLSVPGDVTVAGFNDTPEAQVLHPPLTTVRVFPEQVGRALGALLLERIRGGGGLHRHVVIPTQLVRRESAQSSALRALPRPA